MMKSITLNRTLLCTALLLALSPIAPAKEDPAAKAEAEQIAKEEEEARRLGSESNSPLVNFDARGRLTFYPADSVERKNNAFGIFASEKGTYIFKIVSPELLKKIETYDRKDVTLLGKLRGEGKYFIIEGIGGGGAPPAAKTNKKRI
jgi:hypothetical protein